MKQLHKKKGQMVAVLFALGPFGFERQARYFFYRLSASREWRIPSKGRLVASGKEES